MPAPRLAYVGVESALVNDDALAGWQRYLQSTPLSSTAEPTVGEPIRQTLANLAFNWITFSLLTATATGTATFWAFSALVSLPPAPDCNAVRGQTTRDRITCLQNAIAAGEDGALATGLNWVGQWEPSFPLFSEGNQLLESWSKTALQAAQTARHDGDLAEAIDLVLQIPHSSPQFLGAQTLLGELQQEQERAAIAHYEAAQQALQRQDWALAQHQLENIEALEHPQTPTGLAIILAGELAAEQQAAQLLAKAKARADEGTPTAIGAAIAIARSIDANTRVGSTAPAWMNQWSDELLPVLRDRAAHRDFVGAMAIARAIAENPQRRDRVQDWLTLAQAHDLVNLAQAQPTTTAVGLYPAVLAAHSIHPESPAYAAAIAQSRHWSQTFTPASPIANVPALVVPR